MNGDGPASPPLRVVLWGTCDTGKPRVRILRDGLRANGVEVVECRADVWSGVEDKSQIHGIGRWTRLLSHLLLAYPRLLWQYLRLPRHDWVLLGYPAIPDIFAISLFARLRGARIAMDWFLSAYDTVVCDRRLVGRWHPLAGILWLVEWLAVRLADLVFMDTGAHARRMEGLFRLERGACGNVWVGAEEAAFVGPANAPQAPARAPDAPLRVLFYGQFIPLHGVPTIIEAARLLRDEPVDWLLIGRGQEAPLTRRMLAAEPLPRLRWIEWVDYEALVTHIRDADVCLGIFGTSAKAASVIPNKIFQALAAGRPVVTRDSPAMRELLGDDADSSTLIPPGMPAALADAIMRHMSTHATTPAPMRPFTTRAIGRQLADLLAAGTNAAQVAGR